MADLLIYFLWAAFSLKSLEYMCIRILMLFKKYAAVLEMATHHSMIIFRGFENELAI